MGDVRLIGFFGNLGSYKTALCTVFGKVISESFGIPIFADYQINLPHAQLLDDSELLGLNTDDAVIILDEIVTKADSRVSAAGQNRYYGYFVSQARKSPKKKGCGNFVLYTSQLTSMVDCRIFDLTNMYFMLEKDDAGNCDFTCVFEDNISEGTLPYEFFVENCFDIDGKGTSLYNTDEKIMPLSIDSLRVQMEQFNSTKINARVDAVCDDMLKKYRFNGWKDVRQFTVYDYCLRNGVPKLLVRDVFNRLCELVRCG